MGIAPCVVVPAAVALGEYEGNALPPWWWWGLCCGVVVCGEAPAAATAATDEEGDEDEAAEAWACGLVDSDRDPDGLVEGPWA